MSRTVRDLESLAAVSHRRDPLPTHAFAGSDSERQSVGDPGHCEACARYGHVAAHPTWGCAEAGCTREHGPDEVADRLGALRVPTDRAAEDTTASTCSCPEHTRHPAWSRRACYRREHPLPGDLDQHAALLRAADLARKP